MGLNNFKNFKNFKINEMLEIDNNFRSLITSTLDYTNKLIKLNDSESIYYDLIQYNLLIDIRRFLNHIKEVDFIEIFKKDDKMITSVFTGEDLVRITNKKTLKDFDIKIGKLVHKILELVYNDEYVFKPYSLQTPLTNILSAHIANGVRFNIVDGDKIRDIYTMNSTSFSGQLASSCMQGRDLFDLYVNNKDVIKMSTLIYGDGILARCLLFKNESDGKWHYSRIYHSSEKYGIRLEVELLNRGYIPIHGKVSVKLKTWFFDEYPYVDKINYLDFKEGRLMTGEYKSLYDYDYTKKNIMVLDDINGKPQNYSNNSARYRSERIRQSIKKFVPFWN